MITAALVCPNDGTPLSPISITVVRPEGVALPDDIEAALASLQSVLDRLTRYRCPLCHLELSARELVEDWAERGHLPGAHLPSSLRHARPDRCGNCDALSGRRCVLPAGHTGGCSLMRWGWRWWRGEVAR